MRQATSNPNSLTINLEQIRRKKISALVKKYPVLSLLVLSIIFAAAPYAAVATGVLPQGFSQLSALSASLAGIVLAAVEGRKGGVRELLGRFLIWRVGIQWWAFALLFTVIPSVAGLYLFNLFGGPTVDWSGLEPLYSVVPMILMLTIFAGMGEEFGWRGFAMPRLQTRYNALVSSIIIGVVWGMWHIPLFLVEGTTQYSWRMDAGLIPAVLWYTVYLIAWSIQYTWVFNNTKGSVLLAAVLHGAGNAWTGGYIDVYTGAASSHTWPCQWLFPSSSSLWPVRPIFPAQTRETCSSLRKDSQTVQGTRHDWHGVASQT